MVIGRSFAILNCVSSTMGFFARSEKFFWRWRRNPAIRFVEYLADGSLPTKMFAIATSSRWFGNGDSESLSLCALRYVRCNRYQKLMRRCARLINVAASNAPGAVAANRDFEAGASGSGGCQIE